MTKEQVGSIHISREGFVATVELHAPWRGNALDNAMLKALTITLHGFAEDIANEESDAPRCVILKGAGDRHFSTGYFLNDLLAQADDADIPITDMNKHPLETAVRALDNLPCPSIASIQGRAIGAGCELALTCDLRVGSEQAIMGMPPAKLGILYSITGMRRLTELVGLAPAKELLFTALPVDSNRALRLGMLNHRVSATDLEAKSTELALAIAKNAPLAIRYTKRVINDHLRLSTLVNDNERRRIDAMRHHCFSSEDFRHGVKALLSKTDPEFKGR
jgi:enoyl-CoA hydratase/carnithine racemase